MEIFTYILVFIFGTIIGSFLNVVVLRFGTGESMVHEQSRCMTCNENLTFYEMIPILSYIFLQGKCRHCLTKISIQYSLVEAVTGFVFLVLFNQFGIPQGTLVEMIVAILPYMFFAILIATSVYDIKHFILPDDLIFVAGAVGLLFAILSTTPILIHLTATFGMSGFFFLLWAFSKGKWMGFGDVKLAFVMGLMLNIHQAVLGLLLAFWAGALVGIFLMVQKGYTRKMHIPFGPFIVLGGFIAFTVGTQILAWYNNFIGL